MRARPLPEGVDPGALPPGGPDRQHDDQGEGDPETRHHADDAGTVHRTPMCTSIKWGVLRPTHGPPDSPLKSAFAAVAAVADVALRHRSPSTRMPAAEPAREAGARIVMVE